MNITEKIGKYLNEEEIIENHIDWKIIDYFNRQFEAFDKPSNIQDIQSSSDLFSCSFTIEGTKYIFTAKIVDNTAIILFNPVGKDPFKERKNPHYVGRVFASLFESIKILLSKNKNIEKIGFNAETNNLNSLYKKMIPYILKQFPDWEYKEQGKNNLFLFSKNYNNNKG